MSKKQLKIEDVIYAFKKTLEFYETEIKLGKPRMFPFICNNNPTDINLRPLFFKKTGYYGNYVNIATLRYPNNMDCSLRLKWKRDFLIKEIINLKKLKKLGYTHI